MQERLILLCLCCERRQNFKVVIDVVRWIGKSGVILPERRDTFRA